MIAEHQPTAPLVNFIYLVAPRVVRVFSRGHARYIGASVPPVASAVWFAAFEER